MPLTRSASRKRRHKSSEHAATDQHFEAAFKKLKTSISDSSVQCSKTDASKLSAPLSVDSGNMKLLSPYNGQPCSSVDSGHVTMSPNTGFRNPWSVGGHSGIIDGSKFDDVAATISSVAENASSTPSKKDVSRHVRRFLQKNFSNLKEELIPGKIPGFLYQKDVLDKKLFEMIETGNREDRCEALLWALCLEGVTEKLGLQLLETAFKDQGYSYLVKNIRVEIEEEIIQSELSAHIVCKRLTRHNDTLEEELDPELVIDPLVDSGVLSISDHRDIKRNISGRPEKVKMLIKYIKRKPEKNFIAFCNALKEYYPVLSQRLTEPQQENETNKDTDEERTVHINMTMAANPILEPSVPTVSDRGSDDIIKVRCQLGGCDAALKQQIEKRIVEFHKEKQQEKIDRKMLKIGLKFKDLSIGSILLQLSTTSVKAKSLFLKMCLQSPTFLKDLFQTILGDHFVPMLQEKEIDKVDIDLSISFPDVECWSLLKKVQIVERFSYLEEQLQNVTEIVEGFVKFEKMVGIKTKFKELLEKFQNETCRLRKNEEFLRTILSMPDFPHSDDFGVCLLEKMLRETGQGELLKKIIEIHKPEDMTVVADDIQRNYELIQNEIEPRMFVGSINAIKDDIYEKIMTCPKRKDRCKLFLDFIIGSGQATVNEFMSTLEWKGLTYIKEAISLSKKIHDAPNEEYLRDSLLSSYEKIELEVEPLRLIPFLTQRQVISGGEASEITKLSRIQRIIWLMKKALETPHVSDLVECFKLGGYTSLANEIDSGKDLCRQCPRHTGESPNSNKTVRLRTSFQIGYKTCEDTKRDTDETAEAITAATGTQEHKARKVYTENWLSEHFGEFTVEFPKPLPCSPPGSQQDASRKGFETQDSLLTDTDRYSRSILSDMKVNNSFDAVDQQGLLELADQLKTDVSSCQQDVQNDGLSCTEPLGGSLGPAMYNPSHENDEVKVSCYDSARVMNGSIERWLKAGRSQDGSSAISNSADCKKITQKDMSSIIQKDISIIQKDISIIQKNMSSSILSSKNTKDTINSNYHCEINKILSRGKRLLRYDSLSPTSNTSGSSAPR